MKITIDIDCTADEARTFLGLPDVKPMQEAMMAEAQARLRAAVAAMEPESLMRMWMPGGAEGLDRMQKTFWGHLQGKRDGG